MEVFFARYKISYFPQEKINNLNNLKNLILFKIFHKETPGPPGFTCEF